MRNGESDIYPISLTPYLPKMDLGLNDFDKFLSWSTADRALLRGSLFHRITAERTDIVVHDFVFP